MRAASRRTALLALALAGGLLAGAGARAAAAPAASRDTARPPVRFQVVVPDVARLARHARDLEDFGIYDSAAVILKSLRAGLPADADLDLALALDLARSGDPASAREVLRGPTLAAAVADTTPVSQRRPYGPERDRTWTNGRFDGWRWAVARAEAEVDARLGRWREAREAAEGAIAERPLAGTEWLAGAVCAARAGDTEAARRQATVAATLDPMLPEAPYLLALLEWRAGRRAATLEHLSAAVAIDSLYEPAVRARQRLRFFPGTAPDSLPAEFLTGPRAAELLASPVGPKLESDPHLDKPAVVVRRRMVPIPDSLQGVELPPLRLVIPVLVDERGRAILCHLPWFPPRALPPPFVSVLLRSLPLWEFAPAQRLGKPVPCWAAATITLGAQ